ACADLCDRARAARRTVAPPRIEVPPATRAARVLGTRLSFEDEDFDTPTYQRRSQQHATSRE
ncbi:MAG TPA: hypothetical protein PLW65_33080, partial [Pseudomonadota bacterium]|nr:hypothetical protein [Pseudomonadota bacterium]